MFVGGFRHTGNTGFFFNSFFISDDGFRFDNLDIAEFLLQVIDTDFDVEFSASGNDVFTSFFCCDLDQRVGFGEFFQTIDQFREVLGVLGSDGDSDDRGDGVFHRSDVMSINVVGDSSGFQQVLVDTDQSDGVSTRNVGNELDGSTHHQNGSLNGFFVEIVFLSGNIVGSHESDFHTSGDGSGEDSSEGKESGFIGSGHHLGDVHHKGAFGVAVSDGSAANVISGTFIEVGSSIFLGYLGGWEVEDHHFKNDVGGIEPFGHDSLEEVFSGEFEIFFSDNNF